MQRGSVNKVILVGRLGQVPEIRYAPSGTAIANFSIATNEVRRDKDGNNQESTDWHRIVAFGKTAEFIQQYIKKGDMIYVEGRLQTRNWEDKDGVKRNVTEILSSAVTPLSSSGGRSGEGGASKAIIMAEIVPAITITTTITADLDPTRTKTRAMMP